LFYDKTFELKGKTPLCFEQRGEFRFY